MNGAMSGPIAAGMRRTIRCPEATSCHHVLKSKTSFGRRLSPVFRWSRACPAFLMPDVPLRASFIIFGGLAAERNLMWGSDAVEYGAKGYKIRSLWLLVLLVLSMEVFM